MTLHSGSGFMPAPPDDPSLQEVLGDILKEHQSVEGALLPILHAVQDAFGYIPASAHAPICAALLISRAELHGVLSFYHDFRDHPPARHVVKLCRAEACQAMGCAVLGDQARAALGVDWHGTTADGRVGLEPVYCLGLCACGPAAMVDGQLVGRLNAARLTAILGGLA